MRKQMLENAAFEVATQVRTVEDSIDCTLLEIAELQARLMRINSIAHVGAAPVHSALQELAAALGSLVAEDLEFFHDNDGLSVGKQAFLDSTRQNICGKVRRDLVPGTLEVYRLGDYGALEIGVHRFHHPGRDDTEPVGEGKFVIIWQRSDGAWKMTRTISYAHSALPR